MYRVVSITNWIGELIDLTQFTILYIGKDRVIAKISNYGFMKNFSEADGYTVITEKMN